MRDRLPAVLSVIILTILVVSTWIAAQYATREVPPDAPKRQANDPDLWTGPFVTLRTDAQGRAIQRLEGDYLRHYPNNDSYLIDHPRAFNLPADAPALLATARTATVYEEGDHVVMQGEAVMIRQGDESLEPLNITSDEIILRTDTNMARTDLPAVAVRGLSRLSGVGMHYDNNTRELNVFGSTDLEIAPRILDKEQDPS